MGFLLLGIDSLIAGAAVGAIVKRQSRVPLAAMFGIADGIAFLIGATVVSPISDGMSTALQTGILVALGVYLIVVAVGVRRVASGWPLWVLPWVLSIDNLTFGLVGDRSAGSLLSQAGQQAVSSALLGLVGLLVGAAAVRMVPALQRSRVAATGFAGAALIVAAGLELLVG